MQATCTSCWTRYSAGTTYCKTCQLPIAVTIPVVQHREITGYRVTQPPIVWTARWLLLARMLCLVVPIILAFGSPEAATWLFGTATGARFTEEAVVDPHGVQLAYGALVIGGLIAWAILAYAVRWFPGRMAVFGIVFFSAFIPLVTLQADLSVPFNAIDALAGFLCCSVLGYTFVNPDSTS